MRNEIKIFGFKVTISGAFAFIVTGILLGVLNEFGKDVYNGIKSSSSQVLINIIKSILSILFFKIETNVLTLIISLVAAVPIYRLLNRKVFGKIISETIFVEDFSSSSNFWEMHFWVNNNQDKTNRIENNLMIFEASPQ